MAIGDVNGRALLNWRKSFKQDSVPNAKKGASEGPPYVMIAVFVIMAVLSFVLAMVSV